jgi:hypothetical protein
MTFRRSIETISRYFQEVLYVVGELHAEMILPPSSVVPPKIQNSRRWNPFFKVDLYCKSEIGKLFFVNKLHLNYCVYHQNVGLHRRY